MSDANNPTNSGEPQTLYGVSLSASLTVRDLAASLAWYRDVVGFTVEREYERNGIMQAAALQAGNVRILLGQDNGAKGSDRVKGEGFSLMITTEQSVDALARKIKDGGGTLESEPMDAPTGARVFRLLDPDGFRLVISSLAGFR